MANQNCVESNYLWLLKPPLYEGKLIINLVFTHHIAGILHGTKTQRL